MEYVINNDNLLVNEKEVRDEIINLFNPVLKFILAKTGYDRFKKYGFNSCRQTAIMVASYLNIIMPDYKHEVFEGNFVDIEPDKSKLEYIHAYVISSKNDRRILIDVSRVHRKLLFHLITDEKIYPFIDGYKNTTLLSSKNMNLYEAMNIVKYEYISKMNPKDLFNQILLLTNILKTKSKKEQVEFRDWIYSSFTLIK